MSSADASLQLRIMSVFTTRAILAGFMVVTQLLNIVRASGTAALGYLESVYSGREPPLKGIEGRNIRLAGKGSDVTEVSMVRYGAHILPVFEDPAQHRHLVAQWSLNGRVPLLWHFNGHFAVSVCCWATHANHATSAGNRPSAYVSVCERMRLKQEVNVLIDSKAPLLLEVLRWCERFVDDRKTLVLDVTPHNFTPLRLLLEHHGYSVLTPAEAVEFEERERVEIAAEAKAKAEVEEQDRRHRQSKSLC
ncbi:uncharacterized protein KRP23_13225 [Phytophthora ramorum]|uniref:uncharacterized protein n=1 Tax=Phytophthora ramorum TaxID=164328 RepID=UPI0030AA17FD|nr:hypothetical protein KRP23_13225 [Phytophthora ramorum]